MEMQFRIWLELASAEVPPEFVHNGRVTLYRYSKTSKGPTYLIDPGQAVPNSYSRQEFRTSDTPRTFFYLDPNQRESMIGSFLYEAEVPATTIYNLLTDPLGLKAKTLPDFSKLFGAVKESGFQGVYYKPPQGHIVCMFVPIVGRAASLEKVA